MYKVIIDGEEISVSQEDLQNLDSSLTPNGYHILVDGASYRASKPKVGRNSKTGTVHIDNKRFQFAIKDQYDQLVDSMGLNIVTTVKLKNIIAPMPGLILDIMVSEGDVVNEGDSILILEAMKMENVIKAEGSGVVISISNTVGETVEKGQLIIEIE